jgi:hypothetical protein
LTGLSSFGGKVTSIDIETNIRLNSLYGIGVITRVAGLSLCFLLLLLNASSAKVATPFILMDR